MSWPAALETLDLDRTVQIISAVALVLYLAPAVQRFRIPPRAGQWMRRTALALVAVGIAASAVMSIAWFAGR